MDKGEGVILSLQSPLPNEHEVGLNTSLILSAATEKETKELAELIGTRPAFVSMLLAHAGFYGDCKLRCLMEQTYKETFNLDFSTFWTDVTKEQGQLLLCECSSKYLEFLLCDETDLEMRKGMGFLSPVKCCEGCQAVIGNPDFDGELSCSLPDLANTVIGKRVYLVAEILRNFSFNLGPASVMAWNETMLRFLIVMAYSEYQILSAIAFDIISNISRFFGSGVVGLEPKPGLSYLYKLMSNLIVEIIMSSCDSMKLLRSFEGMCGAIRSGDEMNCLYIMDRSMLERSFQILACATEDAGDVFLTLGCLEYILSVTETGYACQSIVAISYAIRTLMNFVFFEVKDSSLSEVRIVKVKQLSEPESVKKVQIQARPVHKTQPNLQALPYVCEWEGCLATFKWKKELRWHIHQTHFPKGRKTTICKWKGTVNNIHNCKNSKCSLPRNKMDMWKHMEQQHNIDSGLNGLPIQSPSNGLVTSSFKKPTTPAPRYKRKSKDAPLIKISNKMLFEMVSKKPERHEETEIVEPLKVGTEEDEVTKSIRLTAALCLRNIAKFSLEARKLFRRYENHLTEMATNGYDCSWAVADLLGYLSAEEQPDGLIKNCPGVDNEVNNYYIV